MWASELLLHWELPLGTYSVGFNYLFFLPVMLPSEVQSLATDLPVRVFPGIRKCLSFLRLPSPFGFHPYLFCLSFYLLYFFLPPSKDNGLLLRVPDVLCQHSEVVLRNLLSIKMFFWWICGGESGLLRHLRTASPILWSLILLIIQTIKLRPGR